MVTGGVRLLLDLVEAVGRLPLGATVRVPVADADVDTVAAWCAHSGNELVSAAGGLAVIRRGRAAAAVGSALADLPAHRRPGARLWLYLNFDCNLACDYCCARSSPQAPRRALGLDRVRRLAAEATGAGVTELYLTGGEPFLLPDLDQLVHACVDQLPTTMLTNGMLFRGSRLHLLRRLPREGLTLQISLDSATPATHDRHRGAGTWQRAHDGIHTALAEGFHVRVAATVAADETGAAEQAAFHTLLDGLGIPRADQVVRPVAQRGFAEAGVVLTAETLVPEVTVTADGVYWHPVGADHDDQLVRRDIFPLATAVDEVRRRFTEYRRRVEAAAELFPCA
jgi:pyruvate-formate lyase-activating enzyme